MTVSRTLEAKLERIRELEDEADLDLLTNELRIFLQGKSGLLAGKAARIAGKRNLRTLLPELVASFERFLINPVKSDPGCQAKCGAVKGLTDLQHDGADLYLTGIRHVQKEPAYGPPVDTADKLRGLCAFGLHAMGYPGLYLELAALLNDPEPVARIAAIQILGSIDTETSEVMLRMRILQGDPEVQVLGDAFSALLCAAPSASVEFVGRFLDNRDPDIAKEAGFTLGECHREDALHLLITTRHERIGESKDELLIPIAMSRLDPAFDYLLHTLRNESTAAAKAALEALRLFPLNPEREEAVEKTRADRGLRPP